MTSQKIHWLPLSQLPLFTTLVDGMLQDTQEMYPLLLQTKDEPWVMDDATIDRTLRLYTERLEMLPTHTEQITRWRKERLTPQQKQELDRLEKATVETQELVQRILAMATAMQAYTIDSNSRSRLVRPIREMLECVPLAHVTSLSVDFEAPHARGQGVQPGAMQCGAAVVI
jgi:hypothetical protein